jgi:hypothetical protein
VSKPRAHADGSIDLSVKVPGPGRLAVLEKSPGARGFVFGRGNATARRAGKLHVTIRPTGRARQALQGGHRVRVTVSVGYKPKGGTQRIVRLTVAA